MDINLNVVHSTGVVLSQINQKDTWIARTDHSMKIVNPYLKVTMGYHATVKIQF